MADEVEDKLKKNALGPASVQGDSGSVTQHNLKDQIAVVKFQKSANAFKKRRGFHLSTMIPGGSVK